MQLPTRLSGQVMAKNPVRSLFLTDPSIVIQDGLVDRLKAIGITHLEMQIYHGVQPYSIQNWEGTEGVKLDWCGRNGFRLLGLGDCAFGTSYRQQPGIVSYVAKRLADSEIVDGIEMKDECRNDPTFYNATDYIKLWRDAKGPPIAWNGLVPFRMETPALSDYSSRYWQAYFMQDRKVSSIFDQMNKATVLIHRDKPFNMLAWCCDTSYSGNIMVYAGVNPKTIITQVWIALILGASGIRMYAYDWNIWQIARQMHVRGQTQTGAKPGDNYWPAIAIAYLSYKKYELQLKQPHYEPVKADGWLIGRWGSFICMVNISDETLLFKGAIHSPGAVLFYDIMQLLRD